MCVYCAIWTEIFIFYSFKWYHDFTCDSGNHFILFRSYIIFFISMYKTFTFSHLADTSIQSDLRILEAMRTMEAIKIIKRAMICKCHNKSQLAWCSTRCVVVVVLKNRIRIEGARVARDVFLADSWRWVGQVIPPGGNISFKSLSKWFCSSLG